MRFLKLTVEAFQGVERAEIELGPGLNILYGPNDLGKSTLATAMRAVLLLAPRSAGAEGYGSWYADATPRVALTFVDDAEHYWLLKKAFGSVASAELSHSKDGKQFGLDCTARAVDEKIRKLLSWGVPAPGGDARRAGCRRAFLRTRCSALRAASTRSSRAAWRATQTSLVRRVCSTR